MPNLALTAEGGNDKLEKFGQNCGFSPTIGDIIN